VTPVGGYCTSVEATKVLGIVALFGLGIAIKIFLNRRIDEITRRGDERAKEDQSGPVGSTGLTPPYFLPSNADFGYSCPNLFVCFTTTAFDSSSTRSGSVAAAALTVTSALTDCDRSDHAVIR
jgi:hypothetical protein